MPMPLLGEFSVPVPVSVALPGMTSGMTPGDPAPTALPGGEPRVPPGWPPGVPPAGADGWRDRAVSWLLDYCPADYRGYDGWRRHPLALAWIAGMHIDAQVAVMREAYRSARVRLGGELPPEAVAEVMRTMEVEGLRLRAAAHAARLLTDALEGKTWVPRL